MAVTQFRFLPGDTKKLVSRVAINKAGQPIGAPVQSQAFSGPYVDVTNELVRDITASVVYSLRHLNLAQSEVDAVAKSIKETLQGE